MMVYCEANINATHGSDRYKSSDGASWTLVGSVTLSFGDPVLVGLAVTSGSTTTTTTKTATIDNVSIAKPIDPEG